MKTKSNREIKLQANLKALVQRLLISGFPYESDLDRYEKLLRKMYELKIEPEILLKKTEKNNNEN
jgi:hypothetical protein